MELSSRLCRDCDNKLSYINENPWYKIIADAILTEEKSGQEMFMGFPDRWFADPHYRCKNDHVSTCILKSESKGNLCLECYANVRLTFPEDRDGPCVYRGISACATPQQIAR